MAYTKTYFDTLASVSSAADSNIIVVQTENNSNLNSMKKTTVGAIRQPIIDMIASNAYSASNAGSYVAGVEVSASGALSAELKGFDTNISENNPSNINAPTSKAVKDYVSSKASAIVSSGVSSAIESLVVPVVGENGKYISAISESNGKISPVAKSFDTEINDYASNNNAPTTEAVKEYVDTKINSLDVEKVGGDGYLIKEVAENNGKISADVIELDSNSLGSSASKVPTSKVVYDSITALNGSVGNANTLIKSISQNRGKITGSTISITNTVTNDPNTIPTSQAVYTMEQRAIGDALSALDYSSGASGAYIKYVYQNDGQVSVRTQNFDTAISSAADNNNIPTSLAVKNYVDLAAGNASEALANITYESSGADGNFVWGVNQDAGKIQEIIRSFENRDITNASFASRTDTAPTVRAVANQINRIDNRINSVEGVISNLDASDVYSSGAFVSHISQENGQISASTTSFVGEISASTSSSVNNIAPTEHAVREAINALKTNAPIGSAIGYIKYLSESKGIVSAQHVLFDTYTAASGWSGEPSDENVPTTLAVNTLVERAKEEILEQSKAMTYEGTVSSVNDLYKDDYVIGRTYIATADFNLGGSSDPKYAVHVGDLIIVKEDVPAPAIFNEDYFDIVTGSSVGINYGSTNPSEPNNFPMFADSTGRILIDSGENVATFASRVAAASTSASLSASAAACAASSAIFASGKIEPYIENASSAAATASSYASRSSSYANNASNAASLAGDYKNSASGFATEAENFKDSAYTAKVNAENYRNDASSAASAAIVYEADAFDSKKAADTYEKGASISASYAEGYMESAGSNAIIAAACSADAQNSATSASISASQSESFKNNSSCSASYAASYEESASGSASATEDFKISASNSSSEAKFYRNNASNAATSASNFAISASNSNTAASNAASDAIISETSASNAASKTLTYETSASSAANAAVGYRDNASSAASKALTYETSASSAANAAVGYRDNASNAANAAVGYRDNASNAANATVGYRDNASRAANATVGYRDNASRAANATVGYRDNASSAASATASIAACSASYAQSASLAASNAASYEGAAEAAACGASSVKEYVDNTFIPKAGGTFSGQVNFGTNGYVTNTGAASFAGSIEANSFNAMSSRKLKENIKPTIVSALEVIDSVNIVDFNYVNDDEKTPHVGFIAEDTDKLLSTPHQNKMDYTNCIGVLLKAVQEMTKGMASLAEKME